MLKFIIYIFALSIFALMIFMVDDDKEFGKELRKLNKYTWRRLFISVFFLTVFLNGAIIGWFGIYGDKTTLWMPYILGGMPGYAVGVIGVKWWNQIDVFMNAAFRIIGNPLGLWVFTPVAYWVLIRDYYDEMDNIWRFRHFIALFLAELFLLMTTDWSGTTNAIGVTLLSIVIVGSIVLIRKIRIEKNQNII